MNKEEKAVYNKKYRAENKDRLKREKRVYYEENKDKILDQKKGYQQANKERIASYMKQYNIDNKEELTKKKKEYWHTNKHVAAKRIRTPEVRLTGSKSRAKQEGREWTIPIEDFKLLLLMPCYYCQEPLPETGKGLDRIDNSKGYSKDNVLPCCADCNRARGDRYTVEEWKAAALAIKALREKNRS